MKDNRSSTSFKKQFFRGIIAALPIGFGYIPVGLAFGVLAQKAGLSIVEIGLMSIMVFAGSSQFIAVSMIGAHAGIVPIVLTTGMVNLRHFLMSSVLAVRLRNQNKIKLSFFSFGITDESFGVNVSQMDSGSWSLNEAMLVNYFAYSIWIASTMIGGFGGQYIPEKAFGIDYALISMFVCLLVFQLKSQSHILTGIISGIMALLLSMVMPGNGYVIIASIVAASLGMAVKKKKHSIQDDRRI